MGTFKSRRVLGVHRRHASRYLKKTAGPLHWVGTAGPLPGFLPTRAFLFLAPITEMLRPDRNDARAFPFLASTIEILRRDDQTALPALCARRRHAPEKSLKIDATTEIGAVSSMATAKQLRGILPLGAETWAAGPRLFGGSISAPSRHRRRWVTDMCV